MTGTVASKDVGTGKAVTFSGVTLKAPTTTYKNYSLKMDTTKTIDITQRELTVSANVANRIYNGLTTVTVSNETITGWATPDTALDKNLRQCNIRNIDRYSSQQRCRHR